MMRLLHSYCTKLPPLPSMYIDGWLYVLIAFFSAWLAVFSSDVAARYISEELLFWLKSLCQVLSLTLLALKMFRSTSFADHKERERAQVVP